MRHRGLEPFRAPDIEHGSWAVWYDPDGRDGDYAVEVDGEIVREYVRVEGLIDDPPAQFLCIEVILDPCPEDPRLRAALGTKLICERGGEETFVDELP